MAWVGGGGVDTSNLRQQLHFLELLGRSEIPHEPNPNRAQQSVRGQGCWQGFWASGWAGLRQIPDLGHSPHWVPPRPYRLWRPVARRQPENPTPPILADVRIPLHWWQQHYLDEHRRSSHMHPQLPPQQRPRFRHSQRLCRFEHRHIHRPLFRSLRRRPCFLSPPNSV